MAFWRQRFVPGEFMLHGLRYPWDPKLVWLHVVSDSLIALSYFAISLVLLRIVRRRRDVAFSWTFVLVGVFIVASGGVRAMDVWNLWHADYWLSGVLKAIAAIASVPIAILLAKWVPQAVRLPSADQWIKANARLAREVQERRELELDLRIRETSYREQAELLDLTHEAIFVRGLDSRILYWNRGSERLYGWQKEEARQKISHVLLRTEFPEPLPAIENQVYEKGAWEGELVHYRRDGRRLILSSRWALQADAAGKPSRILEVNRDITERKLEENKFRNLLESAPDAMIIVNREGRIDLVNAQAVKLFGYSREEMIGEAVEQLVPERLQAMHAAHRAGYTHAPKPRAMGIGLALHGRRKDGSEFPVEISLSPIETEQGVLISGAIRDITERQRFDQQIRELNEQLKRRVSELGHINRELETFSYSVSHDLRTPLRHIDGFARILKEEHSADIPADAQKYLERILDAANHMGDLIDDLLNLARIGRKELVRKSVDLGAMARRAAAETAAETAERKIEWQIDPLPKSECDPGLVDLVFSNLLSNAVKFSKNHTRPEIHVGAVTKDGEQAIFVRDNGVGFDQKYADKLFGVFQRLHSQHEFEGTGIGLATVQRIIHRHGGRIWAEAERGRGATFFFTLGGTRHEQSHSSEEVKLGIP
jgi:PAS domain S-box-containing protein